MLSRPGERLVVAGHCHRDEAHSDGARLRYLEYQDIVAADMSHGSLTFLRHGRAAGGGDSLAPVGSRCMYGRRWLRRCLATCSLRCQYIRYSAVCRAQAEVFTCRLTWDVPADGAPQSRSSPFTAVSLFHCIPSHRLDLIRIILLGHDPYAWSRWSPTP